MEYRDLYNSNRMLTGKAILKGQPIPKHHYIMMVVIFIENDHHEFLIQKKSLHKGGKWASISEIKELMEKDAFHQGHYQMFQDCLEYLKDQNSSYPD